MPDLISKIMVVLANPEYDQDSRGNLVNKLCKEFMEEVTKKGISVDFIDLYKDSEFNPIFDPEEKDTKALEYQIRLKKAQMLVIFHPVWNSFYPAILKGFIDKVFTRGYAYQAKKTVRKGLLTDKTALVFAFNELPVWEHMVMYRNLLKTFWTKAFFSQTGIRTQFFHFGNLRSSSDKTIDGWHKKIERVAKKINSKDTLLDLI